MVGSFQSCAETIIHSYFMNKYGDESTMIN